MPAREQTSQTEANLCWFAENDRLERLQRALQ
jgi:hypothetical protein